MSNKKLYTYNAISCGSQIACSQPKGFGSNLHHETNHINDVKSAKQKKSFVVIIGGNDKWEKFSIPGSNKNYVTLTQVQQ